MKMTEIKIDGESIGPGEVKTVLIPGGAPKAPKRRPAAIPDLVSEVMKDPQYVPKKRRKKR